MNNGLAAKGVSFPKRKLCAPKHNQIIGSTETSEFVSGLFLVQRTIAITKHRLTPHTLVAYSFGVLPPTERQYTRRTSVDPLRDFISRLWCNSSDRA